MSAQTYTVTLDDLKLFADAACELDYLNGYLARTGADQRLTVGMVEKTHAAIARIAGPDAGEIYAPDDGSEAAQS